MEEALSFVEAALCIIIRQKHCTCNKQPRMPVCNKSQFPTLINTGTSLQQRKMRGDLKKEILNLLDGAAGSRGIRWADLIKQLGSQSSVPVESNEFSETIRALETEGIVKVVGDRDRRTIKRIEGG